MTWQKTSFERQQLFDKVWATPVTKLAKGYGLSDVGLRQICIALDVPLPPRGQWQKLAAGKTIQKPTLQKTTAPTTYSREMFIAEVDEVLEERVTKAREATPDAANPDYTPPLDLGAFSPESKLVMRALKSTKLDEGAFTSVGVTWADISVSPDLKERAFLLVDRFAHELKVLGAKFENSHPPLPSFRRGMRREAGSTRNCFTLHGQRFFLRIKERITQELVPPPPPEPQKKLRAGARQTAWEFHSPEYRYIPTGKLHASIVDADNDYESYKVEDTARGAIEVKVRKSVRWVEDAALRHNVVKEVCAERELAAQRPRSGRLSRRTRTRC